MKLPIGFYLRENTLTIAKELIGKFIYTNMNGEITGGMIVETEAYIGPEDRGSHAFEGRRTAKNDTMYQAGGVVYMYICYGIHDMLNIVTGLEGSSHAILIRAVEPTIGIKLMQFRRGDVPLKRLCKGPGSLAKALGLNKSHDQTSLTGNLLWIEDEGLKIKQGNIIASPRVGLSCPEPYLSIPWRFTLFGNSFVSK
ncbi:MAG: DNA-3-methyladenine glycosylase [Bacteroidetes bacterium]|nr:DNA-3-methyladenine glycosylase [Bacteroidota bacterium]MBU1371682.1 DNA-3-methyladenine glycosylase [Bacteroidota bacterium]MBU1486081.1 DNA-3-methyladenine glycosylase [Bacteroidota bacterium]MBU1759588.1 DNA-3-methyladenine glycosylase [Bacteroidota bacterium]MBU2047325.1 DNA-3-methyladenine glycosylase [Bacteroidota bacterium]